MRQGQKWGEVVKAARDTVQENITLRSVLVEARACIVEAWGVALRHGIKLSQEPEMQMFQGIGERINAALGEAVDTKPENQSEN